MGVKQQMASVGKAISSAICPMVRAQINPAMAMVEHPMRAKPTVYQTAQIEGRREPSAISNTLKEVNMSFRTWDKFTLGGSDLWLGGMFSIFSSSLGSLKR